MRLTPPKKNTVEWSSLFLVIAAIMITINPWASLAFTSGAWLLLYLGVTLKNF